MVEAPRQPFLRMTSAALPVKAAYLTDLHALRQVAREGRLAGAGPAEQAKDLRAGLSLSQSETAMQRLVLLRRPLHHQTIVVLTVPTPAISPSSTIAAHDGADAGRRAGEDQVAAA